MNKKLIALALIVLTLSFLLGRWTMESTNNKNTMSQKNQKPMYWIDSMEPTIHYPGPGKSRMGMELTPVYADEHQNDTAVHISPALINNLGIRLAPVVQSDLAKTIETVGYVEPNENQIGHIHTYADGWVKNLVVKTLGETVKKGQLLLQYYSPQLVTAQEEYLIALENKNPALINASYKKLQALHISEQQIKEIKTTHKANQLVAIYAPQEGIVAQLNIREGMRVTPDIEMMSLVDLTSVWMIAQIFEEQANWVHIGDCATAKISAFPQKQWKGAVEYIYPQLDATTRTVKVRFRFENPDNQLKPNMYVRIVILTKPKANVLNIPLEALIRSSQGDRVIVALGQGRFEVRSVTVGIEAENQVEIISGLKRDEQVVISGQFLLDSESNLKAGLERLQNPKENINDQVSTASSDKIIEAFGTIKEVNPVKHSLTIQHDPIPTLNWPAMEMNFSVSQEITLDTLKTGDSLQFNLEKKNNQFIITKIKKLQDDPSK
ncbi:TPA: efflux RND transporter periplasmic adaptor subunit [Legionella pneumophila]|uniref:efflux RND transporter periplasmic adaptor subunit n=1 Tax=Legionella pneumophila TaxID=446 RepID=UPI000D071E63|nr:efflux RND transporter periplasmic adaptor subunit [Legionella pneumophila]MCH9115398.1 efflux RND transporter periplasmic adaptor subunit [Legionella pneumophila serogroup 1]HAT1821742.1 efflux RND transporter periplasmic adaptor subunit [Legionella pneumophila]HAU1134308.1 efflux RND transporter periplasmic adaptor subunit [Legionella pneumophila]HAU1180757.1 efflux RND transporter periplasmic adaptor subunit [Legionella pneumophila]HAU1598915.1 efflux RND transporter periplasmic adaptor 